MTVNTALLEQVMQHIEDHPEQHDQSMWVNECGTSACFAGWACLLSGWTPSHLWTADGPVVSPDTLVEKDTQFVAADLLGIDPQTAYKLFGGWNTRPMLKLMVKDLLNGEALRDMDDYQREAAE